MYVIKSLDVSTLGQFSKESKQHYSGVEFEFIYLYL